MRYKFCAFSALGLCSIKLKLFFENQPVSLTLRLEISNVAFRELVKSSVILHKNGVETLVKVHTKTVFFVLFSFIDLSCTVKDWR